MVILASVRGGFYVSINVDHHFFRP